MFKGMYSHVSLSFLLFEGGEWDTPRCDETPVTTGMILVFILNLYTRKFPLQFLLKITSNLSRCYLEEAKVL